MTINEAEKIINVVSVVLQNKSYSGLKPRTLLKGYSNGQIVAALKLVTAKQFLQFCESNRMDIFQSAVDCYSSIPMYIAVLFEKQEYEPISIIDESITAFAAFCQSLGSDDKLYWQNVYTRIGLDYDGDSPKGGVVMQSSSSGLSATIKSVSESTKKTGCLVLFVGLLLTGTTLWYTIR